MVGCLSDNETVGLVPVVLLAFVRIGTSAAAFSDPLTPTEASAEVRRWLQRAVTTGYRNRQRGPGAGADAHRAYGAGGGLATDALIAALGIRHRAVIHTADTDFARFPGVKWFNPITGRRG